MSAGTQPSGVGGWAVAARGAGAALLLLASVLVGAQGHGLWQPLAAAAGTALGLALLAFHAASLKDALLAALPTAAMIAALAVAADPTLPVWHAPASWLDLARMSSLGAGLAMTLLLLASGWSLAREGRLPALPHGLALLALPFLFGGFFLLAAPGLLTPLGHTLGLGLVESPVLQLALARTLVLLTLQECLVVGLGWLMDRRWSRDRRLHGLLLAAATLAALSPHVASLGTTAMVADLSWTLRTGAVTLAAAVAFAGLWAQTFLLTGVMLDAIHGRRPSYLVGSRHWRDGATKGAIYSAIFVLLVQLLAAAAGDATLRALFAQAPLASITSGELGMLFWLLVGLATGSAPGGTAPDPARRAPARAGAAPPLAR